MKKLLSLLLVLCMVLTLAPAALATGDDGEVRETDFLEDQYHADVNYADMEVSPVTEEDFTAAIEAVKSAIEAGDEAKVEETFNEVTGLFLDIVTNMTLLSLRYSQNVYDGDANTAYVDEYSLYVDILDPFIFLIQDILESPCKEFLRKQLSVDDIVYYMSYTGQTEEEKDSSKELVSLEDAYWEAYNAEYTYEYEGTAWTETAADDAYNAGELSEEAYTEITRAIAALRNEAMGAVFMTALSLNTQLAALNGYDNYAEYAYEVEYGRDYTDEDVYAFADAVKEYIVPLSDYFYSLFVYGINSLDDDAYANFYLGDYTQDETLEAIRPYIGRMSSELLEAWDYMVGHGLYDITYSDTKEDSGYTTTISSYGAPFFFNMPYGYLADFSTILHEFGHYNNFYWHPSGWNDGSSSIDVAEVHSQGLELLFTHYYEDVLGENYTVAQDFLMYNLLYSAIINGAMMGELELYAASTPGVTLQMINEKYRELAAEYGIVPEDDPRTEMYGWVEIPHLTTSPMYYISYATSAAGAFDFWLEAQEDFEGAVDHYLQFVSQSVYSPFLEQFKEAGMENPLSPDYIKELSETLYAQLDVEERMLDVLRTEMYFEDVDQDAWYYEAVCAAYKIGIMNGEGEGVFQPEGTITRAEAATVLWNLDGKTDPVSGGSFSDAAGQWYEDVSNWAVDAGILHEPGESFNGDDGISREEIAYMIYSYALYRELDVSVTSTELAFTDASEIDPWALEAMAWCVENGIFLGDNGALKPQDTILRAELATVMVRWITDEAPVTDETPAE